MWRQEGLPRAHRNSRFYAVALGGQVLYGLPKTFRGLRALADVEQRDWKESTRRGTAYGHSYSSSVVHGNPLTGTEPYLEVVSSSPPGPSSLDLLTREAARPREEIDVKAVEPFEIGVMVDGIGMRMTGLRTGIAWAVVGEVGDCTLALVGVRWPTVGLALVQITDLQPYERGRDDLIEWVRQRRSP